MTMKKYLLLCSFIALGIILGAFIPILSDHSSAAVEQREGIYIFIYSKPTPAYDYQGSIKKSFAISGGPEEMLNSMIRKCKKDYPQAQGIIFISASMDKADCIKFKE